MLHNERFRNLLLKQDEHYEMKFLYIVKTIIYCTNEYFLDHGADMRCR